MQRVDQMMLQWREGETPGSRSTFPRICILLRLQMLPSHTGVNEDMCPCLESASLPK